MGMPNTRQRSSMGITSVVHLPLLVALAVRAAAEPWWLGGHDAARAVAEGPGTQGDLALTSHDAVVSRARQGSLLRLDAAVRTARHRVGSIRRSLGLSLEEGGRAARSGRDLALRELQRIGASVRDAEQHVDELHVGSGSPRALRELTALEREVDEAERRVHHATLLSMRRPHQAAKHELEGLLGGEEPEIDDEPLAHRGRPGSGPRSPQSSDLLHTELDALLHREGKMKRRLKNLTRSHSSDVTLLRQEKEELASLRARVKDELQEESRAEAKLQEAKQAQASLRDEALLEKADFTNKSSELEHDESVWRSNLSDARAAYLAERRERDRATESAAASVRNASRTALGSLKVMEETKRDAGRLKLTSAELDSTRSQEAEDAAALRAAHADLEHKEDNENKLRAELTRARVDAQRSADEVRTTSQMLRARLEANAGRANATIADLGRELEEKTKELETVNSELEAGDGERARLRSEVNVSDASVASMMERVDRAQKVVAKSAEVLIRSQALGQRLDQDRKQERRRAEKRLATEKSALHHSHQENIKSLRANFSSEKEGVQQKIQEKLRAARANFSQKLDVAVEEVKKDNASLDALRASYKKLRGEYRRKKKENAKLTKHAEQVQKNLTGEIEFVEHEERAAEASKDAAEKKNIIKNKANKNLKRKNDKMMEEDREMMKQLTATLQRLHEEGQTSKHLETESMALKSEERALQDRITALQKQKDNFLKEEKTVRTSFTSQYHALADQFQSLQRNFSAEYAALEKDNEAIRKNARQAIAEKKALRMREHGELEAFSRNRTQQLSNFEAQFQKVQMQKSNLQKQKQVLSAELKAAKREEAALRQRIASEYERKLNEIDIWISLQEEAKKNLTKENTKLKMNTSFHMELVNLEKQDKEDGLERETEGLQEQNAALMKVVNGLKAELHSRLMKGSGDDEDVSLSAPNSKSMRRQEELAKTVADQVAWRRKRTALVHRAAADSTSPADQRWTPETDDGNDDISQEMAEAAMHQDDAPLDEASSRSARSARADTDLT